MDTKNSNIAGFMDGYKAGNLSSLATLLNFKKAEIANHLDNLVYNSPTDDSNEAKRFISEIKSLRSSLNTALDSFDSMVVFGDSLNSVILLFKITKDPTREFAINDLKKIAYHFIDLAKRSEDQKVIDVAIALGENF